MLTLERVRAGYGPIQVLWDIELEVSEGEMICLLGRNGAGKTTTLGVCAGQLEPWSGRVILDGRDVTSLPPEDRVRLGLALVPEGRGMLPGFTVKENLQMGAYARASSASEFGDDVDRVTAIFPVLGDRMSQRAGSLSGGEQQMLGIARALMSRPRVLCVDEPSLGLAPVVVGHLYELLGRLRDDGATMLLVEQYAELALGTADRAYVLEKGRLVLSGSTTALASDENLLAAYLG